MPSEIRARQGQHLLQVGVGLFLFTSLEGFAVEYLPFPRLGLSVHTLSVVEGLVLAVLGQLWNRLDLGAAGSAGSVLAVPLFRLCYACAVRVGRAVGSRRHDDYPGGRRRAGHSGRRIRDQGRVVLGCASCDYLVGPDPVGTTPHAGRLARQVFSAALVKYCSSKIQSSLPWRSRDPARDSAPVGLIRLAKPGSQRWLFVTDDEHVKRDGKQRRIKHKIR
jgi:hypothetical protein